MATTHQFAAEVKQVLHLMVHSLYSNKEIFLRELISNASDACDKLRFAAIRDEKLQAGDGELRIEVETDSEQGTLTVTDNGIGMSMEEVVENLGTIAHSGTKKFLAALESDAQNQAELIGQFGVGFYAAFIVADRVVVETRHAAGKPDQAVRWSSNGEDYEVEHIERVARGTSVVLHLKHNEKEFAEPARIRTLIERYSDHIGFPIRMPAIGEEESGWETVNAATALWRQPKNEISDEAYREFFKHVSHAFEDPLTWAHNRVEGAQAYTTLLYLPARAPLDLWMGREERSGLKLYVRRVFIMDAAEQLLPHYLRFVRGVVDSDDLPLNVSRELLQDNPLLPKIRASITKRVLDLIDKLDEGDFTTFYEQFGAILKEGVVEDPKNRDRLLSLLRFHSTHASDGSPEVSLADYVGRMSDDQSTIYYVTAENLTAAKSSPHLEIFAKKNIEVLLLHDRVDEWMMSQSFSFEGKPFRSIAKGELGLNADGDEEASESKVSEEYKDLLAAMKKILEQRVDDIRVSERLTESPAVLVLPEHEMALHMQALLKQAGHEIPGTLPTLEINLDHPLMARITAAQGKDSFEPWVVTLYEQALLAEGGALVDPAAFVKRMNRLMLESD